MAWQRWKGSALFQQRRGSGSFLPLCSQVETWYLLLILTHTHTIRQTGTGSHKGPVTFKSCPVVLNLKTQAQTLNSEVSFKLHFGRDDTSWHHCMCVCVCMCAHARVCVCVSELGGDSCQKWVEYTYVCLGTGSSGCNVGRTHWGKSDRRWRRCSSLWGTHWDTPVILLNLCCILQWQNRTEFFNNCNKYIWRV